MKHTEEKWKATDVNTIANAKTGKQIAVLTKGGRSQKEVTANARRLVLCWNSHDELIEEIKANTKAMEADSKRIISLTKQRNALLDACKKAKEWADNSAWEGREEIVVMLEAAIAAAGKE